MSKSHAGAAWHVSSGRLSYRSVMLLDHYIDAYNARNRVLSRANSSCSQDSGLSSCSHSTRGSQNYKNYVARRCNKSQKRTTPVTKAFLQNLMSFWEDEEKAVEFLGQASRFTEGLVNQLYRILLEISMCGVGENSSGWRVKSSGCEIVYVRNLSARRQSALNKKFEEIRFSGQSFQVVAVVLQGDVAVGR